jgi:hypothetical protein
MSKQDRLDDERAEAIHIVVGLPASAQGTYEYPRDDGSVVHGDSSGEWTLDENGEIDDIVFFASPRSMGWGQEKSE